MTQQADTLKAQVGAAADSESRMLLKTIRDGAAPVSVLVSFAAVQGRPRKTGPGRSSRSRTMLTCRERAPTDLESVLGVSRRESGSRIPLPMLSRVDRAGLRQHSCRAMSWRSRALARSGQDLKQPLRWQCGAGGLRDGARSPGALGNPPLRRAGGWGRPRAAGGCRRIR